MAGHSLGARSKVPLLAVKSFQKATNIKETSDVAKLDQMLRSKEITPSHMGDHVTTHGGQLSEILEANAHLVDKIAENAHVSSSQLVQERDILDQDNVGIITSNSRSFKEKELAQEIEELKVELEDQQKFSHYLLGMLQEMRLKYNETAKSEIDVMGELLVISDLLVKEMRKTDNHRLPVQEIYNLELTKLQSEKAANIRANLGLKNRFQDLLHNKIDANSRFAALSQDIGSHEEDGDNNFDMDEMIENLSQIYPNLSKEVIYNHLITDFRGRSASSLDIGYDVFEQNGGDHGGVQKYPSSVGIKYSFSQSKESSTSRKLPEETSMSSECTICLESLQVNHRYKLKCDHASFHFECIRTWLLDTKSCPICRTPHFDDDEYPSLN